MPGLPHDRPRAGGRERGGQHLGALHVEDDGRAGTEAADGVAAEDDQQLIAVDDLAGLVHRADAVGVAVEGDAQLGTRPPDLGLEVAQVLGNRRIRMVIGECAVRLAEERRHFGAEPLEGGDGDQAPGAVAAVDHHAHRPGQPVAAEDPFAVSGQHGAVARLPSRTGPPALGDDALPELEDILAVKGLPGEHHLEAVELGRIVRPGDLHARIRPERVDAEVEGRRGHRAHVDRRGAGLDDSAPDRCRERTARRPVVASHSHNGGPTQSLPRGAGEGAPEPAGELGRELRPDDAADVVLAKDRLGDVHGWRPVGRAAARGVTVGRSAGRFA